MATRRRKPETPSSSTSDSAPLEPEILLPERPDPEADGSVGSLPGSAPGSAAGSAAGFAAGSGVVALAGDRGTMTHGAAAAGTGPLLDVGTSTAKSLPVLRGTKGVAQAGPLQAFLRQIGRYPLLSAEEEHELALKVFDGGDVAAAQTLVVHNLRLVVKMAYRYRRAWASLLDLIQEGNVGLLEAVRRFDPFKGARFSTYAAYWIRAYMLRFLLDHSRMVRISRTRAGRKLFFRLSKERERLRAIGVEPGPKLLAERLGVSEKDFNEVVRHMDQQEVRLDAPLSNDGDGGGTVLDTISEMGESPEAAAHRAQFGADVTSALASFAETLKDDRERALWNEHILAEDKVSLSELGERFGVTKQRMGQIVAGIRRRVKAHLIAEMGPDIEIGYNLGAD